MQNEPNNLAILRGIITSELQENGGGGGMFEVTTTVFQKDKRYMTQHKIKVAGRAVQRVKQAKLGHWVLVEGEIHSEHIFLLRFFNFELEKNETGVSEGGGGE
jgi:hypothetical protein